MKVLVTGASGRIGRAICARLRREHEVLGLDLLESPGTDIVGNITDTALLRRALRGIDAVVHTAALHAPHVGSAAEAEFELVNVGATQSLAELAVRAGVSRFVFTSTTALYGEASTSPASNGAAAWITEATPPQPRTVYHRSKLAAEAVLETIAAPGALSVTVLRMSRCFPEPAPSMAAYRLHRGIDARDVAQAHALALRAAPAGLRRFVISGATPFELEDLPALATDAPSVLARRAPDLVKAFARRRWRLPQSIDRVYAPALAMRELGWRPAYGFADVLALLDEGSSEVLPPSLADTP